MAQGQLSRNLARSQHPLLMLMMTVVIIQAMAAIQTMMAIHLITIHLITIQLMILMTMMMILKMLMMILKMLTLTPYAPASLFATTSETIIAQHFALRAADLPLKFHPLAIRVSGICMPSWAV